MDPLSIVSASFGLAGAIAKASVTIVEFTRDARDATSDLDALSAELRSLSTVLKPLTQSISGPTAAAVPETLIAQVKTTLFGCNTVVEQIEENIQKYRRDRIVSMAGWALFGQTDTNKLRTSLEAYNTALSLGMHAISVAVGHSVKEDTLAIRQDATAIKLNTEKILAHVNSIRRIAREPQINQTRIEQWVEDMAELSSYAETTYQGTISASTEIGTQAGDLPHPLEEGETPLRTVGHLDKGRVRSLRTTLLGLHVSDKPRRPKAVSGLFDLMENTPESHPQGAKSHVAADPLAEISASMQANTVLDAQMERIMDSKPMHGQTLSVHPDDLRARWFGVSHDQKGSPPKLFVWPRLQSLVSEAPDRPHYQYPSLVSFVGDTLSGKSSIIKAMILMLAPHGQYQVPVSSTEQDQFTSTSSYVHLYADPGTISTDVPILMAGQYDFDHFSDDSDTQGVASSTELHGYAHLALPGLITKGLYPQLLYAFSDVVCFVTPNTRASQDTLWTLFDWSNDGLERTLNQPVRPCLIIIVNIHSPDYSDMLPNIDDTTKDFLLSIESSSKFREYQLKWRLRQRKITTAADLIHCYYDDFRVLLLPLHLHSEMSSTASRVSRQLKQLYHEIRTLSDGIHSRRTALDFNMDVATFSSYFERSVAILARDHTSTLDFHLLSEDDSPLPTRFSEHMALVLEKMARLRRASSAVGGELEVLRSMAPFLACSILCQIIRQPHQDEPSVLREQLVEEACRGLERFRNKFWRCEALSDGIRCTNYWESHGKGHQFQRSSGPVVDLVAGEHECSYGTYIEEFHNALWDEIYRLIHQDQDVRESLVGLAKLLGLAQLESQRTCLACLSNCPTNVLPCYKQQHAICEDCIRWHAAGSPSTGCVISVYTCPLGCQFASSPWTISMKPKEAQSRILVLDGGGIRGIIELTILSRLMDEIRFPIPIQQLFDLVIGMNTGGIIALGVFEMGWTPEEASSQLRKLAYQAFTKQLRLRIPVIKYVVESFSMSRYQSSGIEDALKDVFGSDAYLFGQGRRGAASNRGDDVKVGVVSCLEARDQPCLIANYNRNPSQGSKNADCLQREDKQRNDFKIWQAGRATSATQTYFTPYKHKPTSKVYVESAIIGNNPIRVALEEARKIWRSELRPDIVVSVGSGISIEESGLIRRNKRNRQHWKKLLPLRVRDSLDTVIDTVASTLDCQREWEDTVRLNPQIEGRCHRLDIGICDEKLPNLDEVGKMDDLEQRSNEYLSRNSELGQKYFNANYSSAHSHLKVVARQLLATLFYFSDIDAVNATPKHPMQVNGFISCRLPLSPGALALTRDVRFRLRELRLPISRTQLDRPIIRDIITKTHEWRSFDPNTLSASVQFDIQAGSWERSIEAAFPSTWENRWATIGGF